MSSTIAIESEQLAEIHEILARHLPQGVPVAVFGSRAGGNPKPWLDLDLVLEGPEPLAFPLLGALAEAFDESTLPWKVDVVDRKAVTRAFARIIDATRKELA